MEDWGVVRANKWSMDRILQKRKFGSRVGLVLLISGFFSTFKVFLFVLKYLTKSWVVRNQRRVSRQIIRRNRVGGILFDKGAVVLESHNIHKTRASYLLHSFLFAYGISSSLFGFWLRNRRKYFDDPEAIEDYRKSFWKTNFLATINEYGWKDVERIVTQEMIRKKLFTETMSMDFNTIWVSYPSKYLEKFIKRGYMTKKYLRGRAMEQLSEYNELSTTKKEGELLFSLSKYGPWLITNLDISEEVLGEFIATNKSIQALSFLDILRKGGRILVTASPSILPHQFLRDKFLEQVCIEKWGFRKIFKYCNPWILDSGFLVPSELSYLFLEEIKNLNVIQIFDMYWQWPLSKYRDSIIPIEQLSEVLFELYLQYSSSKHIYEKEKGMICSAFNREEEVILEDTRVKKRGVVIKHQQKQKDNKNANNNTPPRSPSNSRPDSSNNSPKTDDNSKVNFKLDSLKIKSKKQLLVLQNEKEKKLNKAMREFEKEKARINTEWIQRKTDILEQKDCVGNDTIVININKTNNNHQQNNSIQFDPNSCDLPPYPSAPLLHEIH